MTTSLPQSPNGSSERLETALSAVYNWSYDAEIDSLRTLYAKGLDHQWNAMRDLPWDTEIDRAAFCEGFTLGGFPIQQTDFWQSLSEDTRWEIARRGSAFLLSNFLHGEQGALMVASQLVNAVPHMDGKFYAATQTLDEARHVEVFAEYIRKLDHVYPIAPALKTVLDKTLQAENWMLKCVGMQIVVEGLALFTFRDMRNATREPLLEQLLTYVGRDEARHTAYGIKYLRAVVPSLTEQERGELEDFAFEAATLLLDSRSGPSMRQSLMERFTEAGVDPADVMMAIARERDKIRAIIELSGGRRGPVTGFIIPTLKSIDLFSDRIESHFRDMFSNLQGIGRTDRGHVMDNLVDLPEDLEAWVNERPAPA